MTFSERLKELRVASKLPQQKIADEMGVNRVTYTNWENGKRKPELEKISLLAKILHTKTDYLLGKKDSTLNETENLDYNNHRMIVNAKMIELGNYFDEELRETLEYIAKLKAEGNINEDEYQELLKQVKMYAFRTDKQADKNIKPFFNDYIQRTTQKNVEHFIGNALRTNESKTDKNNSINL